MYSNLSAIALSLMTYFLFRRLFEDAEEEEKRMGPNSGLHIIIFDEIDAICKARGSVAGNTGTDIFEYGNNNTDISEIAVLE